MIAVQKDCKPQKDGNVALHHNMTLSPPLDVSCVLCNAFLLLQRDLGPFKQILLHRSFLVCDLSLELCIPKKQTLSTKGLS